PPELLDRVVVIVAVGCGLDVPGVGAGVRGTLLLAVHHHVTRPKTGRHAALSRLRSPSLRWHSTRILGWAMVVRRRTPPTSSQTARGPPARAGGEPPGPGRGSCPWGPGCPSPPAGRPAGWGTRRRSPSSPPRRTPPQAARPAPWTGGR